MTSQGQINTTCFVMAKKANGEALVLAREFSEGEGPLEFTVKGDSGRTKFTFRSRQGRVVECEAEAQVRVPVSQILNTHGQRDFCGTFQFLSFYAGEGPLLTPRVVPEPEEVPEEEGGEEEEVEEVDAEEEGGEEVEEEQEEDKTPVGFGTRTGPWGRAELEYAEHLINVFKNGLLLNVGENVSLIDFLCLMLNCDLERVEKQWPRGYGNVKKVSGAAHPVLSLVQPSSCDHCIDLFCRWLTSSGSTSPWLRLGRSWNKLPGKLLDWNWSSSDPLTPLAPAVPAVPALPVVRVVPVVPRASQPLPSSRLPRRRRPRPYRRKLGTEVIPWKFARA